MSFTPQFIALDGNESSRRFAVLHLPAGRAAPRGLVVHAPALAEEMNKARRMVAEQSRALAHDGFAVLLVDPLGCGDSPGDFGDAGWDIWVDDMALSMAWLRREFARRWPGQTEPPRVLWGLRAGALLAAQAARLIPGPCAMLLWQPATQGRLVLQQLLRLLSAGELISGKPQGAAAAARAVLAAGQMLEVAGYQLSPSLAHGLETAALAPPSSASRLHAFELSSREQATLSPALQSALGSWQSAGWATHAEVVHGPSFWQTVEIEAAPALITATRRAMVDLCARPVAEQEQAQA
jgi:exosortase A-associated hydrolase 2